MKPSNKLKLIISILGVLIFRNQQVSANTCSNLGGVGGCIDYCQNSERNCASGSCDSDDYCHCWDCQGDFF